MTTRTIVGGDYPVKAPDLTNSANIIDAVLLYHLGDAQDANAPSTDSIAGHLSIKANLASPTFTGIVTAPNIVSTGNVNAVTFNGSGAGLTSIPAANLTGTAANIVYTTTTSLPNVTSVNSTTIPGSSTLLTTASAIDSSKLNSNTISNALNISSITSITNTTASTSNTTGALVVAGGIGTKGNIVTTANVTSNSLTLAAGGTNGYVTAERLKLYSGYDLELQAGTALSGNIVINSSLLVSSGSIVGPGGYGGFLDISAGSGYGGITLTGPAITLNGTAIATTTSVGTNSTVVATTEYVDRGYRYIGTIAYTSNTTNINLLATTFGANVRAVKFRVLGGGGGGGGCANAGSTTAGVGGAGGGGAYAESDFRVLTGLSGNNVKANVTIGAGGAAGASAAGSGGVGGSTSFNVYAGSTLISVLGGGGGAGVTANATFPKVQIPASGGNVSTSGTMTVTFVASGQSGGTGSMAANTLVLAGAGGENHLYRSYYTTSKALIATSVGFAAGANAFFTEYGVGGTGGVSIGANGNATGGAGAPGIAFIDFYA